MMTARLGRRHRSIRPLWREASRNGHRSKNSCPPTALAPVISRHRANSETSDLPMMQSFEAIERARKTAAQVFFKLYSNAMDPNPQRCRTDPQLTRELFSP